MGQRIRFFSSLGQSLTLCILFSCVSAPQKNENSKVIDVELLNTYSSKTLLKYAETIYAGELEDHYDVVKRYDNKQTLQNAFDSTNAFNSVLLIRISLKKTIGFLEKVIQQRPTDLFLDRFLYFKAFCYQEQSEMKKAVAVYTELVKNYPVSPLITEVRFRLAEYYFRTERFPLSTDLYRTILKNKESPFIEKALYKLGWMYYLKHDYTNGAIYFFKLADHSFKEGENQKNNGRDLSGNVLGEEGIKFAATCLSFLGDVSHSIQEINKRPYAKKLLIKLAEVYFEQKKYGDVLEIVQYFTNLFKEKPEGMNIRHQIANLSIPNPVTAYEYVQKKEDFVQQFSPLLATKNILSYSDKNVIRAVLPDLLREIARFYQNRADKNGYKEDYEKVYMYYGQLASILPLAKDISSIYYFIAESLFSLNRYNEAISFYRKVLLSGNRLIKEPAAYGIVSSYKKMVENGLSTKEKLVVSEKHFVALFPNSSKSGPILFREGIRAFLLQQFDLSIDFFKRSRVLLNNKSEWVLATEYLADSFFNKKQFKEALEEYEILLEKSQAIDDRDIEEKAKKYIPICQVNMAEELKVENKTLASAKMYENAAIQFVDEKDIQHALNQAFTLYSLNKNWKLLDSAFVRCIAKLSNPERLLKLILSVANLLLEDSQYKRAAKYFEKASSLPISEKKKIELINMSSLYYQKGGAVEQSIRIFMKYANSEDGNSSKRLEFYYKAASFMENLGEMERAKDVYEKIVRLYKLFEAKRTTSNPYIYAKTLIKRMDAKYRAFMELKLFPPFDQTFETKLLLMGSLIKKIIDIEKLGTSEFTSLALLKLGRLFENFSLTILESPLPQGLTNEEKEEYQFMLQERAFPFEEQAVRAYQKVLKQKLAEVGNYRSREKSLARLSAIRPAAYKRDADRLEWKVLYPSILTFSGLINEINTVNNMPITGGM